MAARSGKQRARRFVRWITLPAILVLILAFVAAPRPTVAAPWLLYPILLTVGWLGDEYRVKTRQNAFHSLTASIHPPLMILFSPLEAICLSALSIALAQLRR